MLSPAILAWYSFEPQRVNLVFEWRPLRLENRIVVLVSGRAAAQELQGVAAGVCNCVDRPGRDGDRVSDTDITDLCTDPDSPLTLEDIVNLLGSWMVVRCRRPAWRQPSLGETLISDPGVPGSQQLADLRAIFRSKRRHSSDVLNVRGSSPCVAIEGLSVYIRWGWIRTVERPPRRPEYDFSDARVVVAVGRARTEHPPHPPSTAPPPSENQK